MESTVFTKRGVFPLLLVDDGKEKDNEEVRKTPTLGTGRSLAAIRHQARTDNVSQEPEGT